MIDKLQVGKLHCFNVRGQFATVSKSNGNCYLPDLHVHSTCTSDYSLAHAKQKLVPIQQQYPVLLPVLTRVSRGISRGVSRSIA